MNYTDIEWCDRSWNPEVGCERGCPGCYARRSAARQKPGVRYDAEGVEKPFGCQLCFEFRPHLHRERLGQPARVRSPQIIFADSMGDWWTPSFPAADRRLIYAAMCEAPRHHYIVLTKWPERVDADDLAASCARLLSAGADGAGHLWLGVSVTCAADYPRIERLAEIAGQVPGLHTLISFEPLLDSIEWFDGDGLLHLGIADWTTEWIIIGAQTGPGALPCYPEHVEQIEARADSIGLPVFEKDSLLPVVGRPVRREWPEAMVRETEGVARERSR